MYIHPFGLRGQRNHSFQSASLSEALSAPTGFFVGFLKMLPFFKEYLQFRSGTWRLSVDLFIKAVFGVRRFCVLGISTAPNPLQKG